MKKLVFCLALMCAANMHKAEAVDWEIVYEILQEFPDNYSPFGDNQKEVIEHLIKYDEFEEADPFQDKEEFKKVVYLLGEEGAADFEKAFTEKEKNSKYACFKKIYNYLVYFIKAIDDHGDKEYGFNLNSQEKEKED